MMPRLATLRDVPAIAAMHVQAWHETYMGLLPASEIARRDIDYRVAIWRKSIDAGHPVSFIPNVGFACVGAQRIVDFQQDFPRDLYSLYTLRQAHGSGAGLALLKHALGNATSGFTAEVLKGNARATRFYEKCGGQWLRETPEVIGDRTIVNIHLGWAAPVQLPD